MSPPAKNRPVPFGPTLFEGRQYGEVATGEETLRVDLLADPEAMEACYRQLGPMVLAYLRRHVPAQDAEDVLQQVFLDLWRSRHLYDPGRPIGAWVLGIAHKRAVDHLRRLGRSLPLSSDGGGELADHGPVMQFAEAFVSADAVRGALSGLPQEQRHALFLAYFSDLTQLQIAQRLGVPLGTVKARLPPGTEEPGQSPRSGGRVVSEVTPIRDGQQPPGLHPLDELGALIEGELGLEQLRSVVTHVRRCPLCQSELVEVAAGCGALRMASRPEVADPGHLPLPSFLEQLGALDDDGLGGAGFDPSGSPVEASPAPAPAPATVDAPGQPGDVVTPMRRQLRWWMAAAAAAAVVLGIAAALVSVTHHHHTAITSVALSPVDGSGGQGRISMAGDGGDRTMTVNTQLPPTGSDTYYEVWLLREQTGAMVPLGVLPVSGQARYVLPATLVSDYDAVDISLQPNNGSTVHSNDSVLRAIYS